jgi:hypothetical protein
LGTGAGSAVALIIGMGGQERHGVGGVAEEMIALFLH